MSLVILSKEVTASLTLLLYIAVRGTPQGPKLSEEDMVPVEQLPRQSRFGRNIGTYCSHELLAFLRGLQAINTG